MLYLLLAIAIGIGVTVYLIKKGKIKDTDGDFIPDVVEDKIQDIKEDVKEVVKEIKLHADVVKEDLGEVVKEAISKPKQTRKPTSKKSGGSGRRVENKPTTSGEGATVLKNQK